MAILLWTISRPQRYVATTRINMKQIVQAPLMTPDEKSTLYSSELHHFQSFQNQIQNQLRWQNNLQTQLQNFLTTATKSLETALKKPRYTHQPDWKKRGPSYPPGIPATPKAYFLTPPPKVEHPERHWHTGDTDVDESDSDESEREHPDDTDAEETDLGKTEREKPDDTDVKESDSGENDEDEDHRSTLVPWNEFDNQIWQLDTHDVVNINAISASLYSLYGR